MFSFIILMVPWYVVVVNSGFHIRFYVKIFMIDLSRQDQIEPQTTQLDELNGSTDQDITEQNQLTEK